MANPDPFKQIGDPIFYPYGDCTDCGIKLTMSNSNNGKQCLVMHVHDTCTWDYHRCYECIAKSEVK